MRSSILPSRLLSFYSFGFPRFFRRPAGVTICSTYFFLAHYIRSVIRINSGKISDMGTISDFHPAVNRHPSQIPGRFLYMYHLLSRQCQCLAQARTLALCSRKSKRRQPMPTIHSLPPYAQPFRLSIFHFNKNQQEFSHLYRW